MSILELSNISKKFGNHIIFDDYNLTIEEGEFVSIMGASGAGKTTLLNIIGLLEKPDGGNIRLFGIDNPHIRSKEGILLLRNNISYLFQNYGLIDTEDVMYNLKTATHYLKYSRQEEKEKIMAAISKVGLQGKENQKVYNLSGGEQQRIAVAKIILKPSKLILADEPTGSLDADNRKVIMNLLKELNEQGRTIVVVTHDLEVEKCAARHIKLK